MRDDSGPAFPAADAGEEHFGQRSAYMGMTLRDYFAAKALAPIFAHTQDEHYTYDQVALKAYRVADAMLRVRQA